MEAAGAFSIVLESIPRELAAQITRELRIPTIGIGAGPDCDGQILVLHDMIGLGLGHTPKFARRYANVGESISHAVGAYADDVRDGQFPGGRGVVSSPGGSARAAAGRAAKLSIAKFAHPRRDDDTGRDRRTLFAYDAWANGRVLDACAALTPEQFTRDLGSSFRSVRDTLAHIMGAQWIWLERFHGRSAQSLPEAGAVPGSRVAASRAGAEVERELLAYVDRPFRRRPRAQLRISGHEGEPHSAIHVGRRCSISPITAPTIAGRSPRCCGNSARSPSRTDLIGFYRERAAPGRAAKPIEPHARFVEVIHTVEWMKQVARQARAEGRLIGFVPTMGALHAGHLSLVEAARREASPVVVSIFVNPKQFGPNEDYAKYPRASRSTTANLLEAGRRGRFIRADGRGDVSAGFRTSVNVEGLGERLEGRVRPGHFRGVATVVLKLLEIVAPRFAYFGRKDAQQARIIRQMAQRPGAGRGNRGLPDRARAGRAGDVVAQPLSLAGRAARRDGAVPRAGSRAASDRGRRARRARLAHTMRARAGRASRWPLRITSEIVDADSFETACGCAAHA